MQEARKDERGFTLPEVLITIVILGILFAIASSTWQSVVESRRVDSATNQLASDLRLAHSKATNQLVNWRVVFSDGSTDYRLEKVDGSKTILRSLAEHTKVISSTVTASAGGEKILIFKPDGSADDPNNATDLAEYTVRVGAEDGALANDIDVNAVTSRVQVVG